MIIKNKVLEKVYPSEVSEGGTFVVPSNITKIGVSAFCFCSTLVSVIIPDSVTRIESGAFYSCHNLTSVTIGGGVTSIGDHAFDTCIELASIVIPDNVVEIEAHVFEDCINLASVTIGNGVICIGHHAFYHCTNLTSITIPDSVKDIGYSAFDECTNLTSVTIGRGIKIIGEDAFLHTPLKSVRKNYKAFRPQSDGGLVCRTKPYNVGEKASVKGALKICENGIHYCTNLFEIFDYYYGAYGKDFVICECEVSKEQKSGGRRSSKRCARWIIPQRILTMEEVLKILNEGSEER